MKVPDYIDAEEAAKLSGLRLVLGRGRPGAWSVGARLIFDVKGISYSVTPHETGQPNEGVFNWTGHNSAPVAMLDDERARAHWSEIILLAERLQPKPALVPADPDDRMTMFGVCHEICGEDGLGLGGPMARARQSAGDGQSSLS